MQSIKSGDIFMLIDFEYAIYLRDKSGQMFCGIDENEMQTHEQYLCLNDDTVLTTKDNRSMMQVMRLSDKVVGFVYASSIHDSTFYVLK